MRAEIVAAMEFIMAIAYAVLALRAWDEVFRSVWLFCAAVCTVVGVVNLVV